MNNTTFTRKDYRSARVLVPHPLPGHHGREADSGDETRTKFAPNPVGDPIVVRNLIAAVSPSHRVVQVSSP